MMRHQIYAICATDREKTRMQNALLHLDVARIVKAQVLNRQIRTNMNSMGGNQNIRETGGTME